MRPIGDGERSGSVGSVWQPVEMQQVRLGSSGLKVSRIALGCMSFGDTGSGFNHWALAVAITAENFTSAIGTVIFVAYFAGAAYGLVAIPAQTALQEELPVDVRGRVFGVLNMLVSLGSFLPIIAVGPIADSIGATNTLLGVGLIIVAVAALSIVRGPRAGARPPLA